VKRRHSSSLIFAVLLLALSAFATGQTSQSSNQQSDTVRVARISRFLKTANGSRSLSFPSAQSRVRRRG
jgi:hypothetical protein